MIKLVLLLCLAPPFLGLAIYGDVGITWAVILAVISGGFMGFFVGLVVAIDRLYRHTTGQDMGPESLYETLARLF